RGTGSFETAGGLGGHESRLKAALLEAAIGPVAGDDAGLRRVRPLSVGFSGMKLALEAVAVRQDRDAVAFEDVVLPPTLVTAAAGVRLDAVPLALAVLEATLVTAAVGEHTDAAALLFAVLEFALVSFAGLAIVEPLQSTVTLGQAVGAVAGPGDRLAGAGIGIPHLAACLLIGDPIAVRLRDDWRHDDDGCDDECQTCRYRDHSPARDSHRLLDRRLDGLAPRLGDVDAGHRRERVATATANET